MITDIGLILIRIPISLLCLGLGYVTAGSILSEILLALDWARYTEDRLRISYDLLPHTAMV